VLSTDGHEVWDAYRQEWFLFKADLFGVAADLLMKVGSVVSLISCSTS